MTGIDAPKHNRADEFAYQGHDPTDTASVCPHQALRVTHRYPCLESLYLPSCRAPLFPSPCPLQAIQRHGRVEKLSIYNNHIGSVGCRALVAAVKANRSLKMVEFLPGNCAPTRDIKLLAQAVKQNRR